MSSQKQHAIICIQNLSAEKLTKALTNYGVQEDAIHFFASKNIAGSNLLRLNITDILQWRSEIGIAKCNKLQKIVEKIQSDPENFVSKADNKEILQKLTNKKPPPNPRPVNLLPLPPTESFSKRNKHINVELDESEREKAEADEELLVDFLFKEIIKDHSDDEESVDVNDVIPSLQPKVGENTVEDSHVLLKKKSNEESKEIYQCNNKSTNKLENLPGFMNVSSTEAENILKETPNGTYLIRPSKTFYCTLVVKHENIVYNVGIFYNPLEKTFHCDNSTNPWAAVNFVSVLNLINHFKQNPMYMQEKKSSKNVPVLFLKQAVNSKM